MTKGACLRSFEHVLSGSSVKQFVVPFVFVPVRMCVRAPASYSFALLLAWENYFN